MNRPQPAAASPHAVSKASVIDTLAVMKDVVIPTLAKGPLIRRRKVVGMAERAGMDDRAVRRMQALRKKYGPGPLLLAIPVRAQAVILSAHDAQIVLAGSPEPFAAASLEKQAALNHFQPGSVLASHGAPRASRRRLNEATLETDCPMHSMAAHFAAIAEEEMDEVAATALAQGRLDWDGFFTGWYRMVRRIVLGEAAREDHELTDLLEKLRRRGNLAFLRRKDRAGRETFLARLKTYVDDPDPQSLAGQMARACTDPDQLPHHQLPQYLFAFDPGGMASFRTLALLSAHPETEAAVRAECAAAEGAAPRLELLRACFLESLRLWPTTPAILRETTVDVHWGEGVVPKNTQLLIFAPFLHRDDALLEQPHRFDPRLWETGNERPELGLVPFSHGPVVCPAVNFVPAVATHAMRALMARLSLRLNQPERLPADRLPGTLDPYTLDFTARPLAAG